jgi:ABC-type phosphate transport system auxiliary subunit
MTKPHDVFNKMRETIDKLSAEVSRLKDEVFRLRVERDEWMRVAQNNDRIAKMEAELRKHYEARLAVVQTELAILRDELWKDPSVTKVQHQS